MVEAGGRPATTNRPGGVSAGASLAGYVVVVGAVSLSYSAPALCFWM